MNTKYATFWKTRAILSLYFVLLWSSRYFDEMLFVCELTLSTAIWSKFFSSVTIFSKYSLTWVLFKRIFFWVDILSRRFLNKILKFPFVVSYKRLLSNLGRSTLKKKHLQTSLDKIVRVFKNVKWWIFFLKIQKNVHTCHFSFDLVFQELCFRLSFFDF